MEQLSSYLIVHSLGQLLVSSTVLLSLLAIACISIQTDSKYLVPLTQSLQPSTTMFVTGHSVCHPIQSTSILIPRWPPLFTYISHALTCQDRSPINLTKYFALITVWTVISATSVQCTALYFIYMIMQNTMPCLSTFHLCALKEKIVERTRIMSRPQTTPLRPIYVMEFRYACISSKFQLFSMSLPTLLLTNALSLAFCRLTECILHTCSRSTATRFFFITINSSLVNSTLQSS